MQTRKVPYEEVTLALTAKDEEEQPCEKRRESIPDRRDSKCKGPATGRA